MINYNYNVAHRTPSQIKPERCQKSQRYHHRSRSDSESSTISVSSNNSYNRLMVLPLPPPSQYVALDCEMVGTVEGESVAARVVLVDWNGNTILDEYVLPNQQVTDYRTFVSGVTAQDLNKYGKPLSFVVSKVLSILRGKILVGHALSNDLECLNITHPWNLRRDTAYYEPFMQRRQKENGSFIMLPRKLRSLTTEQLGRNIQVSGMPHCPTEDATAAMDLYRSQRQNWELGFQRHLQEFVQHQHLQQLHTIQFEQQRYQYQQKYFYHFPRKPSPQ